MLLLNLKKRSPRATRSHQRIAICLFLFTILLGATNLSAQNYKSAVGLRLGVPVSISYKLNFSAQGAIDLTFGTQGRRVYSYYRWRRYTIGGTYLHNNELPVINGLSWNYGGGASVSFWRDSYPDSYDFDERNIFIGVHGSIGLDYKVENLPINLSLDWQPGFFIGGYLSGLGAGYGALSVRYVLN